ncbi:MAG TPA: LysE family translocator [Thermoleophilaceae bacterium]|nr:LysE family translocator [Thermoleophilaceae bacterium]
MTQDPLVFIGIAALLTITPGADMAMVSRSVLTGGRRDAFATTLGILAGCLVWAIVSAAGVAAVLAASRTAYDALRLAGAAYLVWLGVQSLLAARRGDHHDPTSGNPRSGPGARTAFRQGLLTNLFNPKIAIFYSTFLPQFIGPGDPALLLSIALAGVHIGFGLVWLTTYAWLLDRAVTAFKSSRVRRALDALTGTVLLALGLRLAAERR